MTRPNAMVPSRAVALSTWGVSPAPTTTNGYRQMQATHQRAWGTAIGSTVPRAPHRLHSGTMWAAQPPKDPAPVTLKFAFYPFPVAINPRLAENETPELYPRETRLYETHIARFLLALQGSALTFDFEVPKECVADPEATFYSQRRSVPLPDTEEWHATQVDDLPWVVLKLGNNPRNNVQANGQLASVASMLWHKFSLTGFSLHGVSTPKEGPLIGIPKEMSGLHVCFALRVLLWLHPFNDEEITCIQGCPVAVGSGRSPLAAPASSRTSHEGGFFDEHAAADSDEEKDQLEQARIQSLREAQTRSAASSSTPAGPSRNRALPLPPVPSSENPPLLPVIRRWSTEASDSPLATRRWLNVNGLTPGATVVDLTLRSPTPEISRPTYRTAPGWGGVLDRLISNHASKVVGPTTELVIKAFIPHVGTFFGGDPYIAPDGETPVTIEPDGPFGLLTTNTSWSIGDSVGDAIVKNTLTELARHIFADKAIWKELSHGHVLDLLPAGVPPDAQRLLRLKIYGYSLPVPMSALFACAVIDKEGDAVIQDVPFVRMAAPSDWKILEDWPSTQKGFTDEKLTPAERTTMAAVALEYFNKTASTLVAYKAYLACRILLGSTLPFAQSIEVGAFLEGMNTLMIKESTATFGGSLQPLMLKLSARRIRSPEQVIERIKFTSCGIPDLQPLEAIYSIALTGYLRGTGIVRHPLFPDSRLLPEERAIEADNPCARALMFLLTVTGTSQLPRNNASIQVHFYDKFDAKDQIHDPSRGDPEQHPTTWIDYGAVLPGRQAAHLLRASRLPAPPIQSILRQPVPVDDSCTDFDLYQYLLYRPISLFAEFGGLGQSLKPKQNIRSAISFATTISFITTTTATIFFHREATGKCEFRSKLV
ncbi:hypothetical protein DFH06DRAFT_1134694 [Mycena polygramma]|nr:hypothetical protein DFH06DRAFT_1134694 [Mycena polygramma]